MVSPYQQHSKIMRYASIVCLAAAVCTSGAMAEEADQVLDKKLGLLDVPWKFGVSGQATAKLELRSKWVFQHFDQDVEKAQRSPDSLLKELTTPAVVETPKPRKKPKPTPEPVVEVVDEPEAAFDPRGTPPRR